MTRITNMEHVEVLERLRGVLEHGKMGDKCLIAPDLVTAAIASLSAPQPPADMGNPITPPAEAQPGWYCAHCQRGVDAREVTYSEQHEVCGRYIANDDPPPSAPVGVKAIAAQIRASLGKGATDSTRRRWAIELETLAQQPAAVDGDNPYPAPRNRQEAAALAKLALAYLGVTSAHIDAVVVRCETDLAAQQGGES